VKVSGHSRNGWASELPARNGDGDVPADEAGSVEGATMSSHEFQQPGRGIMMPWLSGGIFPGGWPMASQEILERRLTKSALLSQQQVPQIIPLLDVIRVLNRARISFVLVGAHGLVVWRGKPRATEEVDVVVAARHVKKAVKVLVEAFPQLEPVDLPAVVRLRQRGTEDVAIDVMKPVQQPYCEVFKHTHSVMMDKETYRVPSLEMAIVMKFSAMISPYRAEEDKFQDAHDFIYMVKNNPDFDKKLLSALASLVYADGGKDLLEMIRKIKAGEKLTL
jgi:hypothetical protein